MAYTVDQLCLRTSTLTGLSDAPNSPTRLLMDEWVQEAIAKVFQETQCVVTDVTVGLTADIDEYQLDRGVLTVLEFAQVSSNPSAKISVLNAKDILERKFLTGTGDVRYFAVLGGNLLIVSPAPDQDQEIVFYAVPVPDQVLTTDDIFDTGLPTYGQRAVECYMNEKAFEANRDYQSAQYWRSEYEKEKGKILITMRRQAGRTLPANRIGYPDRVSTPSRNDTYSSL